MKTLVTGIYAFQSSASLATGCNSYYFFLVEPLILVSILSQPCDWLQRTGKFGTTHFVIVSILSQPCDWLQHGKFKEMSVAGRVSILSQPCDWLQQAMKHHQLRLHNCFNPQPALRLAATGKKVWSIPERSVSILSQPCDWLQRVTFQWYSSLCLVSILSQPCDWLQLGAEGLLDSSRFVSILSQPCDWLQRMIQESNAQWRKFQSSASLATGCN